MARHSHSIQTREGHREGQTDVALGDERFIKYYIWGGHDGGTQGWEWGYRRSHRELPGRRGI